MFASKLKLSKAQLVLTFNRILGVHLFLSVHAADFFWAIPSVMHVVIVNFSVLFENFFDDVD